MGILFSMLLSGNLLFVAFLITVKLKRIFYSKKQQYRLLKTALLLLVTPITLAKPLFQKLLFPILPSSLKLDTTLYSNIPTILITPGRYSFNKAFRVNMGIGIVWLMIAIGIFLLHLRNYMKLKSSILEASQETRKHEFTSVVEKYSRLLHIKRKIKVFITNIAITPFSIGILNPVIIMPEIPDAEKKDLIIFHELCHIKMQDGLIRFLQTVIVSIYWFNPLVYLMDSYLDEYRELACDELVTTQMSLTDKKAYGYLIIDMAELNSRISIPYTNQLCGDKNKLKERIKFIMNNQKKANKYAVLLSIVMILGSSFTAFAYDGVQTFRCSEQTSNEIMDFEQLNTGISFHQNAANNNSSIQNIKYDSQFTDDQGNTYPVTEKQASSRKQCQHAYVDGTYEKHTKNANGGCVLKSYEAQRCSKCGYVKIGTLISETKYTKCPH